MKKIDSDNLFSIFSVGDEELYKEHGVEDALQNPFILLGMVIRGVANYYLIHQIYERSFRKEYESVRESLKLKYFLTLVGYLERLEELQDNTLVDILDEFGQKAVYFAFSKMLSFLEEQELYEKCIIVKKYSDLFLSKKLKKSV